MAAVRDGASGDRRSSAAIGHAATGPQRRPAAERRPARRGDRPRSGGSAAHGRPAAQDRPPGRQADQRRRGRGSGKGPGGIRPKADRGSRRRARAAADRRAWRIRGRRTTAVAAEGGRGPAAADRGGRGPAAAAVRAAAIAAAAAERRSAMIIHIVLFRPQAALGRAERSRDPREPDGRGRTVPDGARRAGSAAASGTACPATSSRCARTIEYALLLDFDDVEGLRAYLRAPGPRAASAGSSRAPRLRRSRTTMRWWSCGTRAAAVNRALTQLPAEAVPRFRPEADS